MSGLFTWARAKYTELDQTLKSEERRHIFRVELPDGHQLNFKTMWDAVKWKEQIQRLEIEEIVLAEGD